MIYLLTFLYFVIGGLYTGWTFRKSEKQVPVLLTFATILTWPIAGLYFLLLVLQEIVFFIEKILIILFTRKMFWLIVAIILIIFACKNTKAHAGVITGEKALAGFSVLMEKKAELGITWYDPEDLELLAQVLEHENYSTGERAMYLTGAVVINRRNSPNWPDTIHDVIYQKGQYSTTGKFWSRPVHQECYRIASWLLIFGCDDVPPNVVYQATFKQGSGVYEFVKTDYFCFE